VIDKDATRRTRGKRKEMRPVPPAKRLVRQAQVQRMDQSGCLQHAGRFAGDVTTSEVTKLAVQHGDQRILGAFVVFRPRHEEFGESTGEHPNHPFASGMPGILPPRVDVR
jgi:hypothetical protein